MIYHSSLFRPLMIVQRGCNNGLKATGGGHKREININRELDDISLYHMLGMFF